MSALKEAEERRKVWQGTLEEGLKTMNDPVNHPKHYNLDPSGIECIEVVRHRNFNIGNAIKYLWRAGLKDEDAQVQDLKKAVWYIEDEIKRLEGTKDEKVPASSLHNRFDRWALSVGDVKECGYCSKVIKGIGYRSKATGAFYHEECAIK